MPDTQYNIYSVDTGYFYSNHEKYLHDMNCRYRRERREIQTRMLESEKQLRQSGYTDDALKKLKKGKTGEINVNDTLAEYLHLEKLIKHKREKAKQSKEKLLTLLANKAARNELTGGRDHIRRIREDSLKDTNVVSVFASALSRTIGIRQDELTESIIIVQVYYFDIFKDISFYGFMYKGEKYKYFTSSAGQIRMKKTMFIQEKVWNRIQKTIMCGLTVDRINSKGGNNANKHLAYMALANSATDEWNEFDIDKSIVIDDFETNVYGTFDFVDETDYSITRKTDYVPVPHTDGAGMILPGAFGLRQRNMMVRLSWIKGLLGIFDFVRFIRTHDCSPVIRDIYGQEHDVIQEDIQVIFTKSQFKMHEPK